MSDRNPLRASRVRRFRLWIEMNRCDYRPGLCHDLERHYALIGQNEVWPYDKCKKCGLEEDDVDDHANYG